MYIRLTKSRSESMIHLGYCQKAKSSCRFRQRRQFYGIVAATMLLLERQALGSRLAGRQYKKATPEKGAAEVRLVIDHLRREIQKALDAT